MRVLIFTLFRTFKNIDLMVEKYRFGKASYIKQINDIWEWQKIMREFSRKRSWSRSTHGRKEEEVGTLLLGSDKTTLLSIIYLLS